MLRQSLTVERLNMTVQWQNQTVEWQSRTVEGEQQMVVVSRWVCGPTVGETRRTLVPGSGGWCVEQLSPLKGCVMSGEAKCKGFLQPSCSYISPEGDVCT